MTARPFTAWRQVGWALLGALLVGGGFASCLPYIRSEAPGVLWPTIGQAVLSGLMVVAGLAASRRAGRWQYLVLAATGLGLLTFTRMTGEILLVSGVRDVVLR